MSDASQKLSEDEQKRYARQLLIWGASGQAALKSAHICLINPTALGCEILKNLVLPGIAAFTIIDDAPVKPVDAGNSFFVTVNDIGRPRAEVTCANLLRHNPFVHGNSIVGDWNTILDQTPDVFDPFTFIIITQPTEAGILKLGSYCENHHKPLLIARCMGFMGHLRLYVPEHTIVDSKPDPPLLDLRLANPWPELCEHCETFINVEPEHYEHVPYICILINEMRKWKASHNDKFPSNRAEKEAFKAQLQAIARERKAFANYDDAIASAYKAMNPIGVPSQIRAVLDDPECINVSPSSSNFWLLAHALRAFVERMGTLPLNGEFPDIQTTITNFYLGLKRVYRTKAEGDLELFKSLLAQTLDRLHIPQDRISSDEATIFAKNALNIMVIRYRPIRLEYSADFPRQLLAEAIGQTSDSPEYLNHDHNVPHNAIFYVLFRLADRFQAIHGRLPGTLEDGTSGQLSDEAFHSDVSALREILATLGPELGVESSQVVDAFLEEVVRAAGGQIHTVCALLGGIGGQEVFKVISRQFKPINNTIAWNGMQSMIWSGAL